MQPRRPRTLLVGNLLIVLGIMLLGATVNAASAGGGLGAFGSVAPPVSVALAAPAVLTPTPTPAPTPAPASTPALSPAAAPTSAPDQAPAATPADSPPAPLPPIIQPSATSAATVTAAPTPAPTPTPRPKQAPATHITIPAVGIDTKVVEVGYDLVQIEGQQVIQWQVADYAAGHNNLSANPGEGGNIVISGHDDWRGEVFRTLDKVKLGDQIILTTSTGQHRYAVSEIEYRKEVGVPLSERLATGMFLAPMPEERVTLVTCWPYGVDDHRLIVIAKPVG
ncbi:MAG TPA: sortase [Thermomicrobiaceae bacterium]|nr:sortase [Thermomicrobiaceae bacterium]